MASRGGSSGGFIPSPKTGSGGSSYFFDSEPSMPREKDKFVDQKRQERQLRETQRTQAGSILVIQRNVRAFLARKRVFRGLLSDYDALQASTSSWAVASSNQAAAASSTAAGAPASGGGGSVRVEGFPSVTAAISYQLGAFLFHFETSSSAAGAPQGRRKVSMRKEPVGDRLSVLCKTILASWASMKADENLSCLCLNPKTAAALIPSLSRLLWNCVEEENSKEQQEKKKGLEGGLIGPEVRMLVTVLEPKNWGLLWKMNNAQIRAAIETVCAKFRSHMLAQGIFGALEKVLLARLLLLQKPKLEPAGVKSLNLWLTAICTVVMYHVELDPGSDFNQENASRLTQFTLHFLSAPLLTNHIGQPVLALFAKNQIFQRCVECAARDKQSLRIIFNSLEGNRALFLLGNLSQLARAQGDGSDGAASGGDVAPWAVNFVQVATKILAHCRAYVSDRTTNLVSFHPIFNWYSGTTEPTLTPLFSALIAQLEYLWSPSFLRFIFSPILSLALQENDDKQASDSQPSKEGGGKKANSGEKPKLLAEVEQKFQVLKRAFTSKLVPLAESTPSVPNEVVRTALYLRDVCAFCLTLSSTLITQKNAIQNRISYLPGLVPLLWRFMSFLSPRGNMDLFLKAASQPDDEPLINILKLFFESAYFLLLILDQEEMYEKQDPFKLEELVLMSKFLNVFVFRMTWEFYSVPPILESAKRLLGVLYDRDSARSFTPEAHWIINEVSGKSPEKLVIAGTSKNPKDEEERHRLLRVLECLPHAMPFRSRLSIFQATLDKDRRVYREGFDPIYVTIRRKFLVEDGFNQLSVLSPADFRKIIKVRFVNELGLNEAGIDQAGVFKEFLEETVKAVFNPSFGLFKTTPAQLLYPSPTSEIHPNHLGLFQYVGMILGKAVYERIALDVPFALFFLSKFFGKGQHIDLLPTLDETLYKSLLFIKKYDGNFDDLALTFTLDEERFGKVTTTELQPGGSAIPVTRDNAILYCYLMADYKLNRETHKQCKAFIAGFKSVLSLGSGDQLTSLGLQLFSPHEIQKLLSGDEIDLDLDDLKKHVRYEGGYHGAHKVIGWLWDTLADLSKDEKKAFLRYVTSCSKPPVGGFGTLDPPLTIRCVLETDASGNQPDRPLSVLTSFLGLGDDVDRLPTASTCFNLLKLPMYKKKSTLAQKLKYAINSGAGFELS